MKTMTWEEIDKDWGGLQKRHRMEIAQAVARYCIGHKISEVAKRLKFSIDWIQQHLNYAGIAAAIGDSEGSKLSTPEAKSGDKGVDHAVSKLMREFAPKVKVQLRGQAGNQQVASVDGDDAEAFQPYLDHYIQQGHEAGAATRLAKAEWAGEEAVTAGVIQETKNKRDEKVNQILFPQDAKETFELDLKMHMARVRAAATFLNNAKVRDLRRQSTCEAVALADAKWREQAELVLQHHQPS